MVTCVSSMHTKYLSFALSLSLFSLSLSFPSVMFVLHGACPQHISASFHNSQKFREVSLLVFLQ